MYKTQFRSRHARAQHRAFRSGKLLRSVFIHKRSKMDNDFGTKLAESEQFIKKWIGIFFILASAWILFDRYFMVRAPINMEKESEGDFIEPSVYNTFTPSKLQPFNGKDDPKVLLAVRGKVYDVTKAKNFYGPGGPYSNFAGRDASRGLAKNSFDLDVLTPVDQPLDLLDNLTKEELEALDGWQSAFDGKYLVVGELINES